MKTIVIATNNLNKVREFKSLFNNPNIEFKSLSEIGYTKDIIEDSLRVCKLYGNAIAGEDIYLCTCIKDDEISSTQGILRETIKGLAIPQTYNFWELCDVYETANKRGLIERTDPHVTSLYQALGKRLYFSKSASTNLKITTKEDIELFEALLVLREKRTKEEKTNDNI